MLGVEQILFTKIIEEWWLILIRQSGNARYYKGLRQLPQRNTHLCENILRFGIKEERYKISWEHVEYNFALFKILRFFFPNSNCVIIFFTIFSTTNPQIFNLHNQ